MKSTNFETFGSKIFVLHKIESLDYQVFNLVRYTHAKFKSNKGVYLTINHLAIRGSQVNWLYTNHFLMISCTIKNFFI